MESRKLLGALNVAERLKDATRHCYTRNGRHESVAEHSWMMTLMTFFMKDEFPNVDMDKVIKMCIIHDLGEAFTGDIPTFEKTAVNEETEEKLLYDWVKSLPENYAAEMIELYDEMSKRETVESKESETGVTIHRVSAEYDSGEIVAQTVVKVLENDTPESLAARVLEREHEFLMEVIADIVDGKISLG